ncbi:MAG: aminotransferase class V-fold PLP-dependent enzyme [Anaerostipes hadrus]
MSKENCESKARKKIAASIGATPEEIYFTSGRADGHLKALKAVVKASKKARPHVIITTMEDPEVLDECSRLERKDAVVTYLDPITTGRVEVAMIENELKENTELISVTAANCQTGTSEPFTGIGTNSNILAAIGRSKAESAESVSFSLKAGTTMEDADKIVDSLKEIVTGERTVL